MHLPAWFPGRLCRLLGHGLLLFVFALLWLPGAMAMPASQETGTTAGDITHAAVTIAPGETAQLPFRAYSLDGQRPLPAAEELAGVAGLADPAIVAVLDQAIQRSLVSAPDLLERFQPQAAIWQLSIEPGVLVCLDYATGQSIDTAVAGELAASARDNETAPGFAVEDSSAVALHEALARPPGTQPSLRQSSVQASGLRDQREGLDGGLRVEGFEFSSSDSQSDPRLPSCFTTPSDRGQLADRRFAGEGAIILRNDGDQAIAVYLATGTIIEPGPDSPAGRLVAWSGSTDQPSPAGEAPEPAPETPSAAKPAASDAATQAGGSETTAIPAGESSPTEPAAEPTGAAPDAEPHGEAAAHPEAAPSGPGSWLVGILILAALIGGGLLALRD